MKSPATYIITNERNGTLYIGVTSDLIKRIWEHKHKKHDGFSKKHNLSLLVYYECHETMENAIIREKQMKKWKRQWKLRLIEENNPNWNDLYDDVTGCFRRNDEYKGGKKQKAPELSVDQNLPVLI